MLKNIEFTSEQTVDEILEENASLKLLYDATEKKLKLEDAFSNLSRVFFDPFEYYLESLGYKNIILLRRDYQIRRIFSCLTMNQK